MKKIFIVTTFLLCAIIGYLVAQIKTMEKTLENNCWYYDGVKEYEGDYEYYE